MGSLRYRHRYNTGALAVAEIPTLQELAGEQLAGQVNMRPLQDAQGGLNERGSYVGGDLRTYLRAVADPVTVDHLRDLRNAQIGRQLRHYGGIYAMFGIRPPPRPFESQQHLSRLRFPSDIIDSPSNQDISNAFVLFCENELHTRLHYYSAASGWPGQTPTSHFLIALVLALRIELDVAQVLLGQLWDKYKAHVQARLQSQRNAGPARGQLRSGFIRKS